VSAVRAVRCLPFGLAGVLLIVAVVSSCRGVSRIAAGNDDRASVAAAAAAFVATVGTYRPEDVDSYVARLAPLTTGDLRNAIATAALDPSVRGMRRVAGTRIESVSVTSRSASVATAAVTAVQSRRWTDAHAGPQSEQVRQRTNCQLVRVDGRWFVTAIELLSEEPAGPGTSD